MSDANLVGLPCQVVVPERDRRGRPLEDDRLCGEPSYFKYTGLIPKKGTRKSLDQRCTLLMCPDHAKSAAQDFLAWTVHSSDTHIRPVTIERLDMVVHRFHCKSCNSFTNVVWDTNAPSFNPGQLQYCPRCGAHTYAMIDPEADYWDVMSRGFDNMPVLLLQMLYSEWDRIKYRRFRDYVQAEITNFDMTGAMMADAT